jgi:hypothetical protein
MADKRGDPREVFDFMHEHDICTGLPKYYVAVASVAEKRGDLAAAEAAYLAGVRVADGRWRDQPKGSAQHDAAGKELAWASKQLNHFQRRLARKLINASAQTTRALHGVSPPSVQQAAARQSPRPIATGRPPMPTAAPSSLQARPFNVFRCYQAPAMDHAAGRRGCGERARAAALGGQRIVGRRGRKVGRRPCGADV